MPIQYGYIQMQIEMLTDSGHQPQIQITQGVLWWTARIIDSQEGICNGMVLYTGNVELEGRGKELELALSDLNTVSRGHIYAS